MQDRIKARIEQLEQERDEIKIAAIIRDKEIAGQIAALQDVLTAMAASEKEETHGPRAA